MAGENEKLDPDILKAKIDILRARNNAKKNAPQEDKNQSQPLEMLDLMSDVVKANKANCQKQEQSNIPKFDVSKRILSQQRNTTAARRTAPGKSRPNEPQPAEVISLTIKEVPAPKSQAREAIVTQPSHNWLIAEIVARDISRLCRAQTFTH